MKQNDFSVLALLSMILGIIGLITSWLPIAIFFNLIALVLGIISLAKNHYCRGMAVAGVSTSAIGITIFVIVLSMQLVGRNNSNVPAEQEQQENTLPEETNLTTLTKDEINDLYANGGLNSDSYIGKEITVDLEVYREVEKHDDCAYVFCCTNKTDEDIFGSTCVYYKDSDFSCEIGDTVTITGLFTGTSNSDDGGSYCLINADSITVTE